MNSSTLESPEAYPGATLEQSIDAATLWLHTAPKEQRRGAWNVLQTLVRLRSEDRERVEAMEKERGLR